MKFRVKTKGHYDFIDITNYIQQAVIAAKAQQGIALVFVAGSTAAITTLEYEQGVIKDLTNVLERIAPEDADYLHHQKWGDRNGAAHIKSALIGTDLNIPIENGRLILGSWQQVVLIDFDERPRDREIVVKIISD